MRLFSEQSVDARTDAMSMPNRNAAEIAVRQMYPDTEVLGAGLHIELGRRIL
jgi:hypothetical protein